MQINLYLTSLASPDATTELPDDPDAAARGRNGWFCPRQIAIWRGEQIWVAVRSRRMGENTPSSCRSRRRRRTPWAAHCCWLRPIPRPPGRPATVPVEVEWHREYRGGDYDDTGELTVVEVPVGPDGYVTDALVDAAFAQATGQDPIHIIRWIEVEEPLGGYRVCSVCGADIAFDPLDLHGCAHCGEPICPACARDGHHLCPPAPDASSAVGHPPTSPGQAHPPGPSSPFTLPARKSQEESRLPDAQPRQAALLWPLPCGHPHTPHGATHDHTDAVDRRSAAAQLSLGLPDDEAPAPRRPPIVDLLHAALAYLGQIGREPAPQPRWTAGDRRYLAGPLIVGDPAWGGDTPAWLRDAVRIARLGLVLAGEHEHASEEEAVAYLMAASLAAPLHHDWAALYFWVAARVLARWGKVGQEEDFWRLIDAAAPQRTLRPDQEDDLHRLLRDIRRGVERHARLPHSTRTDTTSTYKGAHNDHLVQHLSPVHAPARRRPAALAAAVADYEEQTVPAVTIADDTVTVEAEGDMCRTTADDLRAGLSG